MSLFENYRSLRAVGTLFGTVVGVGLFGLPYVFARAGFGVGLLELIILSSVMILLFLMYAEITVQTKGTHRFVTYIEHYLGPVGKQIASVSFIFSMFGSSLAFAIIGGSALSGLMHIPVVTATFIFLLLVAVVIFGGMKFVSHLEVWIMGILLLLYVVLMAYASQHFQIEQLAWHENGLANLLAPFGVIIFALSGFGAIPEMHDILERQYRHLPRVLVAGYVLIVSFYIAFIFLTLGAAGSSIGTNAVETISLMAKSIPAVIAGLILTLIAVFSVFSTTATELMDTLKIDFHFPRLAAWAMTIGVPALLYALGVRTFIDVIGIVGGLFSAVSGILVVLAYEKLKRTKGCERKKCFRLPSIVSFFVLAVFVFGIVIEIVYTIF